MSYAPYTPYPLESLYLDVEVYAGSNIPDAIRQLSMLSTRLGIGVWASMNGVRVLAKPGDDWRDIERGWDDAIKAKWPTASARKRPSAAQGPQGSKDG